MQSWKISGRQVVSKRNLFSFPSKRWSLVQAIASAISSPRKPDLLVFSAEEKLMLENMASALSREIPRAQRASAFLSNFVDMVYGSLGGPSPVSVVHIKDGRNKRIAIRITQYIEIT